MRGRPQVFFQRRILVEWHKWMISGETLASPKETYAHYDTEANTIRILPGFTPREKFVALFHELDHYFIRLLRDILAGLKIGRV